MTDQLLKPGDRAFWRCVTTVARYDADLAEYRENLGQLEGERVFLLEQRPYSVDRIDGNILVTAGLTILMQLLTGAGGTAFNNANARIGVGDSTTAAAIGQTDLQAATNKLRNAMDATFPTLNAGTATFKSTFTTGQANWAWQEWGVFNSATANTGMLNRKVESLGTKTSGSWSLSVDITIA